MKFSIVTPSFRQLDWLRLCVASVSDQDGVEVEHIVQDAGTEGVEEMLNFQNGPEAPASEKGAAYELHVVVEPDAGMYDAINRGLKRATGDICGWLNCDEQYLPNTLTRVAREFKAHPGVDVVFGDLILVDGMGEPLGFRRVILPDRTHLRLNHLNTASCATFFRRSVVDRGLLFDSRWKSIGDAVWMETLLRARLRMRVMGEALAVFAFTGANLSAKGHSLVEVDTWRECSGAPPRWLRQPSNVLHHVRKWMAGAYRKRDVTYAIYTQQSLGHRVTFHHPRLGFSWPAPAPD